MLQTTLCYYERDGKTLMLHRVKKKNDVNHDKWIGIGGKIEPGETPQDCMLREFAEETGLTLTAWSYRGVVTFISEDWTEEMHLFSATAADGTLRACDEGELEWVQTDALTRLPVWEGDKVFLRLMRQGRPFFHLTLVYEGERLAGAQLDGQALDVRAALGDA